MRSFENQLKILPDQSCTVLFSVEDSFLLHAAWKTWDTGFYYIIWHIIEEKENTVGLGSWFQGLIYGCILCCEDLFALLKITFPHLN